MAEQDGIGGRVLREQGVDADRARAEVIRVLTGFVESDPLVVGRLLDAAADAAHDRAADVAGTATTLRIAVTSP